jgi:hypothetical protein
MDDGSEVFRHLPFPFEGGAFPSNLGALIQRTVLNGVEPAREVIHAEDGSWLVGDGINDPNPPGASVVAHMSHVIERNSSVAGLADLPVGHIATRTHPGDPWLVTAHHWEI